MALDIAPDGRVFFIERAGALKIWKPDTEQTVDGGHHRRHHEPGGRPVGVALDPNFATNGHVFLYYSAPPDGARTRTACRASR